MSKWGNKPSNACIEINTLEQGVDLDVCLSTGRQGSFGALTSCAKTPNGALVAGAVLLVLALKLLDKVVHHPDVNKKTIRYSTKTNIW